MNESVIINKGFLYCVLYSIGSIISSFTLKIMTQLFSFQFPCIVNQKINKFYQILLLQQIFTILITMIIIKIQEKQNQINKKIDDKIVQINIQNYTTFFSTLQGRIINFKKTFFLTILFILNQLSGVKAIQVINIPIYLTIRRTLILFVFVFNQIFGNFQIVNKHIFFSIFFITLGAILAGVDIIIILLQNNNNILLLYHNYDIFLLFLKVQDFDDNYFGYYFVVSNNIITSILLITQKKFSQQQISIFKILQSCALNGVLITLFFAYIFDEFNQIKLYHTKYPNQLILLLIIISLIGVFYQIIQFYCNQENSPQAIAISGNFRDIITTFISFFTFSDIKYSMYFISGIFFSFLGAFYFSFYKVYKEKPFYSKIKDQKNKDNQIFQFTV